MNEWFMNRRAGLRVCAHVKDGMSGCVGENRLIFHTDGCTEDT